MQPTPGQIDTVCKSCIFATYEDNTQTGCKLNRIESFKNIGAEIVEAMDSEKEFYVIKERVCNTCRNEEWGENHDKKDWLPIVMSQIMLQCEAYIYVAPHHTQEDIGYTITSWLKQYIKPTRITVVLHNKSKLSRVEVVNSVKKQCSGKVDWQVENISPVDGETKNRCLDIAIKKCKSPFYSVSNAGYWVPAKYLQSINRAINDGMERFVMLTPLDEQGNGLLVMTKIHRLVQGNDKHGIVKKVEYWATEDDMSHMVKKAEELCKKYLNKKSNFPSSQW